MLVVFFFSNACLTCASFKAHIFLTLIMYKHTHTCISSCLRFFLRPFVHYSECLDTSSFILLNFGLCRDKNSQFARSCRVERTRFSFSCNCIIVVKNIHTCCIFKFVIDLQPIHNTYGLIIYFILCSFVVHFVQCCHRMFEVECAVKNRFVLKSNQMTNSVWHLNCAYHDY